MIITKIELSNFRNYEKAKIELTPKLNVLIGNNAQGKTNLLESIFMCAIGKSPRTTKDKDLVKWNKEFAKISVDVVKKLGNKQIELYIFPHQNKAIKIDKIGIKKIGQLMGNLNAIYFSPDELKLIKESPEERRRFMDIDLCQFDKNYFYTLHEYNEILQQRNKLLKSQEHKIIKDTISIWNEHLAKNGAKIILSRLKLIERLKLHAYNIHKELTSNNEELQLTYQGYIAESEETLKNILLEKYKESLEKDIKLGFTTIGPHRDDIKIESNSIDLRSFGSQGQQRTASLSLKLAELEVFNDNLGEYPILLLDDVLSELDASRQHKLLTHVSNIQTVVTCTDFNFNIPHTKFEVVNGQITQK